MSNSNAGGPLKALYERTKEQGDLPKVAFAIIALGVAAVLWAALGTGRSTASVPEIFDLVPGESAEAVQAAVAKDPKQLAKRDLDGNTPLHVAAESGSKELVAVLLSAGADVRATNARGWTPLASALQAGTEQAEIVEALLAAGASPNDALPGGGRVLHLAASLTKVSPRAVRALANADRSALQARNAKGETPIDVATRLNNANFLRAARDPGSAARLASSSN